MTRMVWCVRHRTGWCATSPNRKFRDGASNVHTKCGYTVVLPYGCEFREPTCEECQENSHPIRRGFG